MWLWLGLGWCLAAVGGAALHHRLRRSSSRFPPEVAAFVLHFENTLQRLHPEVAFLGLLPDRFACLLRVDGQETPVGLYELFRRAEAFPEEMDNAVNRLVAEIREVGLDRVEFLEFAAAANAILPQVRSRDWLREQGQFGDAGLVHTPLNDELVVVYAIDDESTLVFLARAHLQRWHKDVADVHNLALANLRRLGAPSLADSANEAVVLRSDDGFAATRMLLLDEMEGLLVAVPDRDTLWAGPEQGQDLERLMALTEECNESAPHPVSPHVFRVTDGRFEPLPGHR